MEKNGRNEGPARKKEKAIVLHCSIAGLETDNVMSESVIVKNKLMPVFNSFVLLLTMNFVITASK